MTNDLEAMTVEMRGWRERALRAEKRAKGKDAEIDLAKANADAVEAMWEEWRTHPYRSRLSEALPALALKLHRDFW